MNVVEGLPAYVDQHKSQCLALMRDGYEAAYILSGSPQDVSRISHYGSYNSSRYMALERRDPIILLSLGEYVYRGSYYQYLYHGTHRYFTDKLLTSLIYSCHVHHHGKARYLAMGRCPRYRREALSSNLMLLSFIITKYFALARPPFHGLSYPDRIDMTRLLPL